MVDAFGEVYLMKRCKSAVLSAAVSIALGLSATATAGGRPDLVANGLRAGVPHQQSELLIQFKAGT